MPSYKLTKQTAIRSAQAGRNAPVAASVKPGGQARIRGEKLVGSGSGPKSPSYSKPTSTINNAVKAGSKFARVAGPVGVVATGASVGYAVGSKIAETRSSNNKMAEAKQMAQSSFEKNKANRIAKSKTKKAAVVTKPKSKSKPATKSAKQSTPVQPTRKGAPVQEGPSRKPISGSSKTKKMSAYDNYRRVMADVDQGAGYSEGGKVKKMSEGGFFSRVFGSGTSKPQPSDLGSGAAANAASQIQNVGARRGTQRSAQMDAIFGGLREGRGKAQRYMEGGKVSAQDHYGSYGGAGGSSPHKNIVSKTTLKRG